MTIISKKMRTELSTYETSFHGTFKSILEDLINNNDNSHLKY